MKSFFTDGVSSSLFITTHKLTRSVNTLHVVIKFKDEPKMQTNATKLLSTHIEFKIVICIYLKMDGWLHKHLKQAFIIIIIIIIKFKLRF